jgi:hypothetical protein
MKLLEMDRVKAVWNKYAANMVSEPGFFVGMFIVRFACSKLLCARVVTVCKS